jgi:hypothetical protein
VSPEEHRNAEYASHRGARVVLRARNVMRLGRALIAML